MAYDFDGMAHHVVENSAALKRALPEPGHVRAAVLFRRAREVRSPGKCGASCPDELFSASDLGCEELILEIACVEPDAFCQTRHRFRFGDVSPERFFAGEPAQLAGAVSNCGNDFFYVGDARLIGAAQPDRVDARIRDHRADGFVRLRVTHFEPSGQCRGRGCVFWIRAPDAEHVSVADAGE